MPLGPSKSRSDKFFGFLAICIKLPLFVLGMLAAGAIAVVGAIAIWRAVVWLWVVHLSSSWRT